MSDRDSGSSFLIGFILGAVAGVAVGFLYAPKSGKETRALLKEKIGEMRGKANEATAETQKRIKDKLG
ncbi:MAG: hypothetical protein A2Z29_06570 [Chloroflexi bacterium RBG_16_56_11]|nr:MAG: hypothetical protein A2Z29_06570 [Chloroflexi bacterium RBG_16_56_11]